MGDEAYSNRSKALAAARAGKPRWVRILVITEGCSMAAMIFKGPPHWGQCSMSISNTRLRKPSLAFALWAGVRRSKPAPGGFVSSRAQLMGAGAAGGGTSAWSADVLALTGRFGTMSGRSLALRPRRAKQALPGPGFGREHAMTNPFGTDLDREATRRVKYRDVFHQSGSDATADGEPARRVVV